jgi:predicted acyltransferase
MTTLAEPQPVRRETSAAAAPTQRLMSVDALRGFDMFWIIGANAIVYALNRMSQNEPTKFLANQLDHADWEGFHFYDLIFPLFVFIVGVSLVFSLSKTIAQFGRDEALKRVFRRGILLFVIGILYSGGFTNRWPDMRLMGVLNRIALAYFFAGLLFCFFKPRALVAICVSLLIGYWVLMTLVPIRDIQLTKPSMAQLAEQAGDEQAAAFFKSDINPSTNRAAWAAAEKLFYATTKRLAGGDAIRTNVVVIESQDGFATNYVIAKYPKGLNLSDHTDFQYLPGKKWDNFFDPEGYLSTIPAIATCLLGVFAGFLLMNQTITDRHKVLYLVSFGVVAALLGWLWSFQFPVIKKIWTSSYVLVAGGYSAILLGVFYLIVDVWQARAWCQPFVWIGMNSITIYLASNIIGGFSKLATRLAGGEVKTFFDAHLAKGFGDLVVAIVGLLLAFWFVHFLYKRKIFLRL